MLYAFTDRKLLFFVRGLSYGMEKPYGRSARYDRRDGQALGVPFMLLLKSVPGGLTRV